MVLTPAELIPLLAEVIGDHDCDDKTGMVLTLAARLKQRRAHMDVHEFVDACLHRNDPRPVAVPGAPRPNVNTVTAEVTAALRAGGVTIELPSEDEEDEHPGSPTQLYSNHLSPSNGALPGFHTFIHTDQPDLVAEILANALPDRRFSRETEPGYRGLYCIHVFTDAPARPPVGVVPPVAGTGGTTPTPPTRTGARP